MKQILFVSFALALSALSQPAIAQVASSRSAAQPLRARRVAVLVYDGVALIDFAGPVEVLSHAGGMFRVEGRRTFEVFTVAPQHGPVRTDRGPRIVPDHALGEDLSADILVIPGGPNAPLIADEDVMRRIAMLARGAEVRMSVCNGVWILGALGYLDGADVTTNAGIRDALRARYPRARVLEGPRVVDFGGVITTSEGATGIEGALRIVERFVGADAALAIAGHMAFPWSPPATESRPRASDPDEGQSVSEMSHARRLFLGAMEKIEDDADPAGAIRWLRGSMERGYESPSDVLREPAFDLLRRDPAMRAELRALLRLHARESRIEIVAAGEPGARLSLEMEIVGKTTAKALPGRLVHVYQTDAAGDYAPDAEPGEGTGNARLFGFARTDAEGRVTVRSILPGSYRGTRSPRHVHVQIEREDGTVWDTAIYFDDRASGPDAEIREDSAKGRVALVSAESRADGFRARATLLVPDA